MIKMFVTLLRGRAAEAAEAVADQNALPLLDQQIRDAAAALGRARRALALAMAQQAQETPRLEDAARRIADLEDRARQALAADREDLATEAAEAIAELEAEQSARRNAQALFAAEAARLRRIVADTEARLAELDRGRRLARAAAAVRGMHAGTDSAPRRSTRPRWPRRRRPSPGCGSARPRRPRRRTRWTAWKPSGAPPPSPSAWPKPASARPSGPPPRPCSLASAPRSPPPVNEPATEPREDFPMNHQPHQQHSGAWATFTYVSFAASVAMVALGILFLPVDLATRGYMAIGMLMLVQSSITATKTVRDQHEGARLHKRIEEARVEELLAKTERGA